MPLMWEGADVIRDTYIKILRSKGEGTDTAILSFSPKNQRGRILVDTPLDVTAYVGAHPDVLDA